MKKKNTFNKYNSIQSIRPKAQTGKINSSLLLDGLSGQERQQAYIRAVDLGLIQTGFTNDPTVIAQQNAAVEQMLQQEASQNTSVPQGPPTPPQGGASPGITPSGGGGLGNQNNIVSMTPNSGYLPSSIPNIGDTQLAGGGRSAEEIQGPQGKLGISQIANAAKMFFPDPKSDPSVPEIDTNDPNFNLNAASSEYNQFLEQMKKVDGTTNSMENIVDSFAGGNNSSKAGDIAGKLKGKEGLLGKAGKFAGKAAPFLGGLQFMGAAMEAGANDQDPTTYKPLEIAADVLQLKPGEIIRQAKQRKEYKKLEEEARNKKVEAGLENSRMQTDAAVNQKYTGQTYNYNTGPQTRFNYKSGGTKKLRGGQQIDLGRPDVGAVMFKGATHKDGGIDHGDVEVEDEEVYTEMKIKNPNTGKTEDAGYYFSEHLKDSDGQSFAQKALTAIKRGGKSKNLKKELSNIAEDNETAAKNIGEMGRDKKYIAKYGLRKKAQTGLIPTSTSNVYPPKLTEEPRQVQAYNDSLRMFNVADASEKARAARYAESSGCANPPCNTSFAVNTTKFPKPVQPYNLATPPPPPTPTLSYEKAYEKVKDKYATLEDFKFASKYYNENGENPPDDLLPSNKVINDEDEDKTNVPPKSLPKFSEEIVRNQPVSNSEVPTVSIPNKPIFRMNQNNYKTGQEIIGETITVDGKPKNMYFSDEEIKNINSQNLIKRNRKVTAQTGKIDLEKAGLTVSNTMDLGAPGIEFKQPAKGSGLFGDTDLGSFKTRFTNSQLPDYLRNSAGALVPNNRNSVGQFQTDYNQYLGEIYDSNPSLSENLNREEFITSQGFQYDEADGPNTIDRDFGEYTSTRPVYTKTPKKEEIPEEKIIEEGEGSSTSEGSGGNITSRLTEIKKNRFSGKDIVPFGQLVPPLYTLMNPYDKLKSASITPGVQLPRIPRVNLEGDKADNRNRTATSFEAMRQAGLDPGSSGVAGNVNTSASNTSGKIAGLENDANKQLAGQETNARLQASMFNTRSLTNQKQFNKRLDQIENQYGREEKLGALDTLFSRIQGIQNSKDQNKALDNYIDVLDEYDSLERKEQVKEQQKARNKAKKRGIKTSEYWIETESRYMTDLEIRTEVAKIFPSLPLPQREEKKHGGYYIGRIGALKNRK